MDWKRGWSAGSLVSDAHDVSVYTHALIAGGFLDAAHRARMQTSNPLATSYLAIGGSDQPLKSFGLGLEEYRIDGIGTAWGHNGEIDGFHNTSAYFIDAGFGCTVLDNLIPARPSRVRPACASWHRSFMPRSLVADSIWFLVPTWVAVVGSGHSWR